MSDCLQPHGLGLARLLSVGFSREEYWSGLRFPSSGDLPDPGIEPVSPALQADSLPPEPPGKPFTVLFCKMRFANSLFFLEIPEEPGRLQSIGFQRARHS